MFDQFIVVEAQQEIRHAGDLTTAFISNNNFDEKLKYYENNYLLPHFCMFPSFCKAKFYFYSFGIKKEAMLLSIISLLVHGCIHSICWRMD